MIGVVARGAVATILGSQDGFTSVRPDQAGRIWCPDLDIMSSLVNAYIAGTARGGHENHFDRIRLLLVVVLGLPKLRSVFVTYMVIAMIMGSEIVLAN